MNSGPHAGELIEELIVKDAGIERLKERIRGVTQVLIGEVGANGPMDAEDAAGKAVAEIARLKEAVRVRDELSIGSTGDDKDDGVLCAYCQGFSGDLSDLHAEYCPTITHPINS